MRHNRLRVRRKPAVSRFPLPPLLAVGMAAGYVIGCCFGANAALPEPSNPVLSFLSSSGAGGTLYGGLLPELCVSCAYGFAFLLLSTSYLGFLLIPAVFGIKGFLSACTAAVFLNSGCDHAFWLSCVAVGLPGIFLVPALFLLGTLCAYFLFARGARPLLQWAGRRVSQTFARRRPCTSPSGRLSM